MKKLLLPLLIGYLIGRATKAKGVEGIAGIKASKFLPPYDEDGRTTFSDTRGKSGVYIIKENGRVVYVGYSGSNLYKTLYRHFQTWKHPYQEVVSYKGSRQKYTVKIILSTPQQAVKLEGHYVLKYEPRDNEQKLKMWQEKPPSDKEVEKVSNAERYEPPPF